MNAQEKLMNATLAKFINLKQEIARLENEAEQIKSVLIPKGSFETSKFTVTVTTIEQMRTVSADHLCTVLDPVLVAKYELVKTITFPKLSVKTKDL